MPSHSKVDMTSESNGGGCFLLMAAVVVLIFGLAILLASYFSK